MTQAGGDEAELTRAALRFLHAGAAAHLHGDERAVRLLTGRALTDLPLADLLETGVLSIAEQLRDVAESRRLHGPALLRVLLEAHTEMAGPDLFTVLLSGADAYLRGADQLWSPEELCALAACPSTTVGALLTLLAAALTWRARDLMVAPGQLIQQICLGLAARDAGLLTS